MAAAGLVDTAAAIFIPAERARGADAAIDDRSWNTFLDDIPFATLDVLTPSFGDGTAGRVTHGAVTGLGLSAISGAADIAGASLVVWLANLIAHRTVAGLIARLADRVTDIAVASLVVWLANLAADRAVARLIARLADRVADIAIASLVTWLADGVALIPPTGVMDRPVALDWHLFDAGVHHRLAFLIRFCTPDRLTDGLVATTVTGSGLTVVLA